MKSLMYLSPTFYAWSMRLLYWPHYEDRYRAVARLIPAGCSVVDVCCGDSYLYRAHLAKKGVRYIGLDSSPEMVAFGQKMGLDVRIWEGKADPVPEADVIILQGSLCHFMPNVEGLVTRLRDAARQYVVISEPIRDRHIPLNPIAAFFSRLFTTPVGDDGAYRGERFTADTFSKAAREFSGFERFYRVPGDRDLIAILSGRETSSAQGAHLPAASSSNAPGWISERYKDFALEPF